jgi:hypothetical protein
LHVAGNADFLPAGNRANSCGTVVTDRHASKSSRPRTIASSNVVNHFFRALPCTSVAIKIREPADKPGSVADSHSSGMRVTAHLKRPTREPCGPHDRSPIWSCSGWGFPCHVCCQTRGALLPHHFTLTGAARRRRYIFCGTFRRLTPPRRYLAPCPVEPGLSSGKTGRKQLFGTLTQVDSDPSSRRLSGRLPQAEYRVLRRPRRKKPPRDRHAGRCGKPGNSPLLVDTPFRGRVLPQPCLRLRMMLIKRNNLIF